MSENTLRSYSAEVWDIMQLLFEKFNDHQARCVIRLGTHIDEGRLRQAVDLLGGVFPLLGCRFVEGAGRPRWESAGFTAGDMVFVNETEQAEDEIQRVLCSRTDEFSGPQLKIHIIRSKHTDTLCLIINHMLCDGAGFKKLLYLLSSIYSRLGDDPCYKPGEEAGSRSARQVLRAFDRRGRAKIFFQRYGLSRHDDRIVFGLDGDRSKPFIVTHTVARERFQSVKSYAKQHGATVNDVILAAYLRALHQILPGRTAAVQCVLDIRKFLPEKESEGICNLTSNLVCDIGPDVGARFDDTLIKVKQAMDAEKERSSSLHLILLLETVFRVMPYRVAKFAVSKGYRNPPLAMSNIGIIDDSRLSFDDIPITGAFITGSIKYSPLFMLSLSTFNDEVTLSAGFHGTQADREKISKFLGLLDEELPCAPA
ncbi:MAG: hypothetical protein P4L75_04460 [Clostridia bacterium]|nr:hypothetical protein [Clostridia bacterium]MDR3644984.1 hypothetical protein [Clostridia bacterium]